MERKRKMKIERGEKYIDRLKEREEVRLSERKNERPW